MIRNSLLASVGALGLVFALGSSAAVADTRDDLGDGERISITTDVVDPTDPGESSEVAVPPTDPPNGGESGISDEENPDPNEEPDVNDPATPGEGAIAEIEEEQVTEDQFSLMSLDLADVPQQRGLGSWPSLGDLLDPTNLWPLPVGIATAEPDPTFKRGTSGQHDPFVVAGQFSLADITPVLDEAMRPLLKNQFCGDEQAMSALQVAINAGTLLPTNDALPGLPSQGAPGERFTVNTALWMDATSPDAKGICESYVDGLSVRDMLTLDVLGVDVQMTHRDNPAASQATSVSVKETSLLGITTYWFAAKNSDFPNRYFDAGTYDIQAQLMADAEITLPSSTVSIDSARVGTGTQIAYEWKSVPFVGYRWVPAGLPTAWNGEWVDIDYSFQFPPEFNIPGLELPALSYTFENQPIAQLLNRPTMTVIEAPTVNASWDYHVGLRVNGDGYDGVVDGAIGFTGDRATFDKYFKTNVYLFKVGQVLPIAVERDVVVDDDFKFTTHFDGLEGGHYFAKAVVTSHRILDIPVNADPTYLQVLDVRADWTLPVLDCADNAGEVILEGSLHNNTVPPAHLFVEMHDKDGNLIGQDSVMPWRTHYDIAADVDAAAYATATFTAHGAKSVTIESPIVEEGECAALVDLAWDPNPAVNVCPATTADSTLVGQVTGFTDGYTVHVEFFEYPDVLVKGLEDVEVDDDGQFFYAAAELGAGEYLAAVTLKYNGKVVDEASAGLEVAIEDCPVPPNPDEKPATKPGGTLPKTGMAVGLAALLSAAALGTGASLRRKSQ